MRGLIVWGLVLLIGYFYYQYTEADRDETGVIVSEGNIDAFSIQVGDCFNDEEAFTDTEADESVEVQGVAGVPCSQPHDNEVFALLDLELDEFPGQGAISELAFDSCMTHFEAFVGRDYETSALDIMTLYPTLESWAQDDREVVCSVYDVDLKKLEGTMRASGI